MARIRRRVRKKRPSSSARVPTPMPELESHAPATPTVLLVGRSGFRMRFTRLLAVEDRVRIIGEADPQEGTFDLGTIPRVDVVIACANADGSSEALETARAIQRRRSSVAVVLIVERVSRRHLAEYWWEVANWSLMSMDAASDPAKLGSVVESAAHGIRWVEPDIGRMLRDLQEQGHSRESSSDDTTDVRDLADSGGDWKGSSRAHAGGEDAGRWLQNPSRPRKRKSLY